MTQQRRIAARDLPRHRVYPPDLPFLHREKRTTPKTGNGASWGSCQKGLTWVGRDRRDSNAAREGVAAQRSSPRSDARCLRRRALCSATLARGRSLLRDARRRARARRCPALIAADSAGKLSVAEQARRAEVSPGHLGGFVGPPLAHPRVRGLESASCPEYEPRCA